jgi:hypothetical protein
MYGPIYSKINLQFPNKEDETVGHKDYYKLKVFFQSFFQNIHGIFLKDGHDGQYDGLVEFSVKYNSFHKCYEFKLCGGNYKEKTDKLMEFFLNEGYRVSSKDTSWCNEFMGRPFAHGYNFSVYQKNEI